MGKPQDERQEAFDELRRVFGASKTLKGLREGAASIHDNTPNTAGHEALAVLDFFGDRDPSRFGNDEALRGGLDAALKRIADEDEDDGSEAAELLKALRGQ